MKPRYIFVGLFTVVTLGLAVRYLSPGPVSTSGEKINITYSENIVDVLLPVSGAALVPLKDAKLSKQTLVALAQLEKAAIEHPSIVNLPPYRRREIHDAIYVPLGLSNSNITDAEERFIPGPDGHKIRIRIYTPKERTGGKLPVIVYYHGGGMMMGSLEQYEPITRRLCQKSGLIVVSVDFRMSPEYKFPAALDDSYAALLWVRDNAGSFGGDPGKLVIAGDSGGGLLAAAMAQQARDQQGPHISYQVLIYPAIGTRGNSKSADLFAKGYVFGRKELEWAYGSWINSAEDMNNVRVQPILATDFSGLPPAYVVSAEYEVMRDDIEEYARLLDAAGVPTVMKRFEGTVHPFMSMAGVIDAGKDVIDEAAVEIRRGLDLPAN
ncbi:MAG: alpha/beta hydrolase [Alphaproteobacteria bacterium]|nr:alpha/beta hydrolase [Alphaproteobacteria bacterium]